MKEVKKKKTKPAKFSSASSRGKRANTVSGTAAASGRGSAKSAVPKDLFASTDWIGHSDGYGYDAIVADELVPGALIEVHLASTSQIARTLLRLGTVYKSTEAGPFMEVSHVVPCGGDKVARSVDWILAGDPPKGVQPTLLHLCRRDFNSCQTSAPNRRAAHVSRFRLRRRDHCVRGGDWIDWEMVDSVLSARGAPELLEPRTGAEPLEVAPPVDRMAAMTGGFTAFDREGGVAWVDTPVRRHRDSGPLSGKDAELRLGALRERLSGLSSHCAMERDRSAGRDLPPPPPLPDLRGALGGGEVNSGKRGLGDVRADRVQSAARRLRVAAGHVEPPGMVAGALAMSDRGPREETRAGAHKPALLEDAAEARPTITGTEPIGNRSSRIGPSRAGETLEEFARRCPGVLMRQSLQEISRVVTDRDGPADQPPRSRWAGSSCSTC